MDKKFAAIQTLQSLGLNFIEINGLIFCFSEFNCPNKDVEFTFVYGKIVNHIIDKLQLVSSPIIPWNSQSATTIDPLLQSIVQSIDLIKPVKMQFHKDIQWVAYLS